jgi:hypothetical protein
VFDGENGVRLALVGDKGPRLNTADKTGYGLYTVRAKVSKEVGCVSAFYVSTRPALLLCAWLLCAWLLCAQCTLCLAPQCPCMLNSMYYTSYPHNQPTPPISPPPPPNPHVDHLGPLQR